MEMSTTREATNCARGQPLLGCPRLLVQYIRSYPESATRGRAMPWAQVPT
jgi:hypothetical protein